MFFLDLPGCNINIDVDKNHDAGGNIKRAKCRIQDIPGILTELKGIQN